MKTIRFGILSTASVNSYGFLPHIGHVRKAELLAIASRDMKKARKYARANGIPRAYGDYDALLSDPEIDCVYIPLPVSMHAEWSIRALDAGKHVLCEKPVTANEAGARRIAEKVEKTGLTFAEAFHYRYHPLSARIEELVRGGDIGELKSIVARFGLILPDKNKVQFKPECAGGALLDVGCYPVSFSRWIAGCDDAVVTAARAKKTRSGVDGAVRASLAFNNGVTARIECSLVEFMPMSALIKGTKGSIFVLMPFNPATRVGPIIINTHLLLLRQGVRIRTLRVPAATSYQSQIEAFCDAVRAGVSPATDINEGIANMRLIDAIYEKAGMEIRCG